MNWTGSLNVTARKLWSAVACGILLVVTFSSAPLIVQIACAEDYFNKNFSWHYQGYSWTWSLSIPKSLYDAYKRVSVSERTRSDDYSFLVTTHDSYVKQVANKLHEAATQEGYGAFDEVSFILAFVQSLPYTVDNVTTRYDEYPRFPIETLVDGGGDCEDTAILFATLVVILDYDTVLISPPSHMAAGVWGNDLSGYYYTYNSRTYYYCETTSENWHIGDMPNAYKGTTATIYSIIESRQYVPGQSTLLPPEALGIIVIGVAAVAIIVVLALWARSAKARKIGEPAPTPPMAVYASDAKGDDETKKTTEQAEFGAFYCRFCGAQNKTDAVFCEVCGKALR